MGDLSTTLTRMTNDITDFYDGMREYWSTRNLMQGYGEAARDITELIEDATRHSNPLVQACAGSGLAVAKMVGAIPIGIDHWVIETAKSTVHHGIGAGFKTLVVTPIEGFVDGGKFVVNQAIKWSHGEISSSTMGVADEVATTLGTAGLMFLGIKGVQSGGTGLVNGLKNMEIHTPALAHATGQIMPVVSVSAGTIQGGPLAMGLVYMNSANGGEGRLDVQTEWDSHDLFQMDVETVEKMSALPELRTKILVTKIASGNIEALQALLRLIKAGEHFPKEEFVRLVIRNPHFERALKQQVLREWMQLYDSTALKMGTLDRIIELTRFEPGNPR